MTLFQQELLTLRSNPVTLDHESPKPGKAVTPKQADSYRELYCVPEAGAVEDCPSDQLAFGELGLALPGSTKFGVRPPPGIGNRSSCQRRLAGARMSEEFNHQWRICTQTILRTHHRAWRGLT